MTDTGFTKLAGLTTLTELFLDRTDIADASAKMMSSLSNLRYIDLYHTQVSEQALQNLKKALPECKINWNRDSTRRERRT